MFDVYRVRIAPGFQRVRLVDPAAFLADYPRAFTNDLLTHDWSGPSRTERNPIRCTLVDKDHPRPDFFEFLPATFAYRIPPNTRTSMLADCLESSGEVVYLDVEGERMYAININWCGALDLTNSVVESDESGRLKIAKYAFQRERIAFNVFRVPETADSEIYTYVSGPFDAPDSKRLEDSEFIHGYRADGLTGLEFTKVWP